MKTPQEIADGIVGMIRVVGDVPDHGAMLFFNGPGDVATPYRVTLCCRCVANPNDESKEWDVIENDELSPGASHWFSTREAAEAAKNKEKP
jgi:hypothetical protein